jgi:hypothetical protein
VRFPSGTNTPFDLTDVDATRARLAHAEATARRLQDLRVRAWAQGFQAALEQVGADVTITDGIPMPMETC